MPFRSCHPIIPAGQPAPRRREGGATPWLVAILSLVVASAFVVDVGVPARIEQAQEADALP